MKFLTNKSACFENCHIQIDTIFYSVDMGDYNRLGNFGFFQLTIDYHMHISEFINCLIENLETNSKLSTIVTDIDKSTIVITIDSIVELNKIIGFLQNPEFWQ